MPQGVKQKFDLKAWSECAMNEGAIRLFVVRNKYETAFAGRHNPA
jgi:hypothetical protein